MKLQRREKILVGLALAIVGLGVLWFLFFAGDSRSFQQLKDEQTKFENEKNEKQRQIEAADRYNARIAEWEQRSLPPDPGLARSLYQGWLLDLATHANFRGLSLKFNEAGGTHRDQCTRISFTLSAKARLGDLVDFMYEFYSKAFLHQIRKMDVKPLSSHDLDINLVIDAYSLSTAKSKKELPKEAGHGLQRAKLSDYHDPIVARDFFAAYVPPPQERKEIKKQGVDPADHTFVTGFTEVDGTSKVWLYDRMRDKTWQLGTGEGFSVGNVKGTVQIIHPEGDVVIEFGGQRRRLHREDNLHGGVEIKDQQPKQTDENDNSDDSNPDEDD